MATTMRGSVFAAGALLAVALSPLSLERSSADAGETLSPPLPFALQQVAVAWDGSTLYTFGGRSSGAGAPTDAIVAFDPVSNTSRVLATRLPAGLAGATALFDGRNVYVFGGSDGSSTRDSILRFDPLSEEITAVSTRLPTKIWGAASAWDGKFAYVLGGETRITSADGTVSGDLVRQIIRFDPVTESISTTTYNDSPFYFASAVWNGQDIFIFGAAGSSVYRYSPSTGNLARMAAKLPAPQPAAVWDSRDFYVFSGGQPDAGFVLRYNATLDKLTRMDPVLPSALEGAKAVWTERGALIVGGRDAYDQPSDEVLSYVTTPGPARNLAAITGPGAHEITLRWEKVAETRYDLVTAFKIYRAAEPGAEKEFVASVGLNQSFLDTQLASGRVFSYWVVGSNAAGDGEAVGVTATTFSPPEPPIGLSAAVSEDGMNVSLTWQGRDEDGNDLPTKSYSVYRSTESSERQRLSSVSNRSFVDHAIPNGTYTYGVSAVNDAGEGPASTVQIRIPPELDAPSANVGDSQAGAAGFRAIDLLLTIQDFPVGWRRIEDNPSPEAPQPGLADQLQRTFRWSSESGFSAALLTANAYVFENQTAAKGYFDGQFGGVVNDYALDKKRFGDEAFTWSDEVGERLVVRKSNVVWSYVAYKDGFLDGGMPIDRAAELGLDKFVETPPSDSGGTTTGPRSSDSASSSPSQTPSLGVAAVFGGVVAIALLLRRR